MLNWYSSPICSYLIFIVTSFIGITIDILLATKKALVSVSEKLTFVNLLSFS